MPFTSRDIEGAQGWRFRENYQDRQLAYIEKEKCPSRDVPQLLQPFIRPAPSPIVVSMLGYPKKMICPNPPPNTSRGTRRLLRIPQNKSDRSAVKNLTFKLSSTSLCGEGDTNTQPDVQAQSQSDESTSSRIQQSPHKSKSNANPGHTTTPNVENPQIKAKNMLRSPVSQQNKLTCAKKSISWKTQTSGNPIVVPQAAPIVPPAPNIHGIINKMRQRVMIAPRLMKIRSSRKSNVEYWASGEPGDGNSTEILSKELQFDEKMRITGGGEINNSQTNVRLPNFGFGLGGMGGVVPGTRLVTKGKQVYPHARVRRDKDYL